MSAIAGIFYFDEAGQDPRLIRKLLGSMSQRGPDGQNHWSDNHIALGHCMLRGTPQSRNEIQPFLDKKSDLVLVYDGRLDNRKELITKLKLEVRLEGIPDTELIMAAFQRWGQDCPAYLLGDFAFVIWDSERKALFCARDQVGAAGFSFVCTKDFFAFATTSEALVGLPGVSNAPNEELIASILVPAFLNEGDRRTWQRDVKGLLPGETLTVSTDRSPRIRQYWAFEAKENRSYDSYRDCEEHFVEVFDQAVRDRMQAVGDLALMLSGGIDSAGIIAMANRLMPSFPGKSLHTYSAIDDDFDTCIESRSILSMSRPLGARAHRVSVPSFEGMLSTENLLEAAWKNAHPVANSILLPALMCLAAKQDGHNVIMLGACGDLAMRAPIYYPSSLLRDGQALDAWRECKAASLNNYPLHGRRPSSIFLRSAWHAFAPAVIRQWGRRFKNVGQKSPLEGSLINAEFAEKLNLLERVNEERHNAERARRLNGRQNDINNTLGLVCSALSSANSVAGRYGVEARDPWSDIRVLDCFFRMPNAYKVQNGWTKYPVRSAFSNELEPFVLQRKDKLHLGWKFTLKLLTESHAMLCGVIEQNLSSIEKFVDLKAFRLVSDGYVRHGDLTNFQPIFELCTLMFWLQRIKPL